MIDIRMDHVRNEIDIIMKNKKRYDNRIVLYTLALTEWMNIIEKSKRISLEFIRVLRILKSSINCHIDFDILEYLCKKNMDVVFTYGEEVYPLTRSKGSTESSLSTSTDGTNMSDIYVNDRITKMVKDDTEKLVSLMSPTIDVKNDDYGIVDSKTLSLSKEIFNLIDGDKDGKISAIEAIRIIELSKKVPLVFEFDIEEVFVQLLVSSKPIDFYKFHILLV